MLRDGVDQSRTSVCIEYPKMKQFNTRSRKRTRSVAMPPTLRYRSTSNSTSRKKKQRQGSRMRLRPWLEDLLDKGSCSCLQWTDRTNKVFTIVWRHASSHGFDQSKHGDLFSRWAQHTGKLDRSSAGDHSHNKSTFRCALNSLKDCKQLTKNGDKRGEMAKRTYQFIDPAHPDYNKKRKGKGQKKKSTSSSPERPQSKPDLTEESPENTVHCPYYEPVTPPVEHSSDPPESSNTLTGLFSGKSIFEEPSSLKQEDPFATPHVLTTQVTSGSSRPTTQELEIQLIMKSDPTECNGETSQSTDRKPTVQKQKLISSLMPGGEYIFELIPEDGTVETQHAAVQTVDSGERHKNLPNFPALGVDTHIPATQIILPGLNAGGNVKVRSIKRETPNLPEFDVSSVFQDQQRYCQQQPPNNQFYAIQQWDPHDESVEVEPAEVLISSGEENDGDLPLFPCDNNEGNEEEQAGQSEVAAHNTLHGDPDLAAAVDYVAQIERSWEFEANDDIFALGSC